MNDETLTKKTAEDLLLLAGDKLTEEVFENFSIGTIDRKKMEDVYATLRQWSKLSEELLGALHR